MEIFEKKLSEIKPYEKNPRLNDQAVRAVKNSIKEFGFKVPIVIDKDGVIICGHTRYKASKELGLKTVPCVIADDLTEEEAKAFRIADNKVQEKSEWDIDLLSDEINGVSDEFNMIEFGFEKNELKLILGEDEKKEEKEEKPKANTCNTNKKRVIITYKDEDAPFLKKLLHEHDDLKGSYKIKEIREEN